MRRALTRLSAKPNAETHIPEFSKQIFPKKICVIRLIRCFCGKQLVLFFPKNLCVSALGF